MKVTEETQNLIIVQKQKECGAHLRNGKLCEETELLNGDRCRAHGGLSTGPRSYEGRVKSALNIGKNYDDLLQQKQFPHNTRARV